MENYKSFFEDLGIKLFCYLMRSKLFYTILHLVGKKSSIASFQNYATDVGNLIFWNRLFSSWQAVHPIKFFVFVFLD